MCERAGRRGGRRQGGWARRAVGDLWVSVGGYRIGFRLQGWGFGVGGLGFSFDGYGVGLSIGIRVVFRR